ncbi:MAG TPA: hypothetical protein VN643_00890 [Pyrinomonadaceae bacterium]|nr:hypothetical protein [Pyrinomonadaceae bacterium]
MNSQQVASASKMIRELIASHAEWFLTQSENNTEAIRREELDLSVAQGRLILSSWTEKGTRSWKIAACELAGDKLLLKTSRRMGAERSMLELIPRASAAAIAATVRAARQLRCEQLARLVAALHAGVKVERAALSPGMRRGQPGRYARIILRQKLERIAVTATVAGTNKGDIDSQLSSALIWFSNAAARSRPPYLQKLWLVVEESAVRPARDRIALLREGLRTSISLFQIDGEWQQLVELPVADRAEVFKKRLARFPRAIQPPMSEAARAIVELAPRVIDVVHARHGETLRYAGLPFARVRNLMGVDRVWFGIGSGGRKALDAGSVHEWDNLMQDLEEHRSATSKDHHHALYRTAGESWLESILRRDITKLDPGLIIAPLHAQFRTARGGPAGVRPIDLLALRRDGRLVVIELKVSEDREHVLQGADYWRRVEAHRRRGHITRARLFGNLKIRDESPLVYLVAPTLRFHPTFQTLARAIAPDIEIYRFDINEDWRSGVRVMRRTRMNQL